MTLPAWRRTTDYVAAWMRSEADEWGVSPRVAWLLAIGPLALAALVVLTALVRPVYRVIINEDGIVEWLQVLVLIGLVIAGLALGARLWRSGHRAWAIVFGVAALGAIFIAGEEISWGQRILGFATPGDLEDINDQGETTLHNIGPLLSFMNLGIFFVTMTAGLAPFIWRWGRPGQDRTLDSMVLVPPLFLATSFLFAGAWRLLRYSILTESSYVISRYNEVGELLLYGALLVYTILLYRALPDLVDARVDRRRGAA